MAASREQATHDEQVFVIAQALTMISCGDTDLEQARAWAAQSSASLDASSIDRCKREAGRRAARYAAAREAALVDLFSPLQGKF